MNLFGAAVFIFALMTVMVGFLNEILALTLQYSSAIAQRIGIAGVILAALIALVFAGLSVRPEARVTALGAPPVWLALRLIPVAALLFGAACLREPAVPWAIAAAWVLLAALLAIYQGIVAWGPSARTFDGLQFQVAAQAAIAFVSIAGLTCIAWATRAVVGVSDEEE